MSKIPEKLHLVFRDRSQRTWAVGNEIIPWPQLPFANVIVHNPQTKGFQDRYNKQMRQAYYSDKFPIGYDLREDGVYYPEYTYKDWKADGKEVFVPAKRYEDNLQPRVLENVPIAGFKLEKELFRSASNAWILEDPRGFGVFITVENLADLMLSGTIMNGEFIGKLQYKTTKTLQWVQT